MLAFKKEMIAQLHYEANALQWMKAAPGYQAYASLISDQVVRVRRQFGDAFDRLFGKLERQFLKGAIHHSASLGAKYIGDDIPASLKEYTTMISKFATLFGSTMVELNALRSMNTCIKAEITQLKKVGQALSALFYPRDAAIETAFNGFVAQLNKNFQRLAQDRKYNNGRNFVSIMHQNVQDEAVLLAPLVAAMVAAIQELDGRYEDFYGSLDMIAAFKWLVSYLDDVHKELPCDEIKQFLVRLVLSEQLENRFGAQKYYQGLRKEFTASTKQKVAASKIKMSAEEFSEDTSIKEEASFAGIPNMGNTCFANACIQALARMSLWNQRERAVSSSSQSFSKNELEFKKATKQLVEMVQGKAEPNKKALMSFFDLVYEVLPNFKGKERGQQRDAQEFWMDVLDKVGIDSPDLPLPIKFSSSRLITRDAHSVTGEYTDAAPMHEIVLALHGTKTKIRHALQAYLQPEPFERQDTQEVLYSRMMFHDPPDVMTFVVNRFNAHNQKLSTPLEISDVSIPFYHHKDPKGLRSVEEVSYKLVGGIYHNGKTTNRGHYYFIDHDTGIVYDDDSTYKVSRLDKKIIQQQSYILFFQRVAR